MQEAPLRHRIWLWRDYPRAGSPERRVRMRRAIELTQIPADTTIRITANAYYVLYVNGAWVSRGPARSTHGRRAFDELDVRPYLKTGRNVFAVLVYRVGVATFIDTNEGESGLWIDGELVRTDPHWKVAPAEAYLPTATRLTVQLGFQEHYDANLADHWTAPDYDDTRWDKPVVFTPSVFLEPRGIPLLTNALRSPERLIACSVTPSAPGWEASDNPTALYAQEAHVWMPAESDDRPQEVSARLLDFGNEVYGTLLVRAADGDCGTLDLLICESLTGVTPDILAPSPARPAIHFAHRLVLSGKEFEHEFTMPLGFRYLVVIVRGGTFPRAEFLVREQLYPLAVTGRFLSSDPVLNAIWQSCEWTQRRCMSDAYMDCPWREQAQWWGDARVQGQNTFRLSTDTRLFERGLRQIGQTKVPGGLPNAFAPALEHNCVIPDFALTWVMTHFDLYRQTGSLNMFHENRARIDEVLEYFNARTAADGLQHRDPRFWLFLDWCEELFRDGATTVFNLFYLMTLREMAAFSGESVFAHRAQALQEAIDARLYDATNRRLCDGLREDGTRVEHQSPHATALAILLGLYPQDHAFWADTILKPLVTGALKKHLQPTPFFMYYIFEAMKALGLRSEVVQCVRNWWGNNITAGFATTPESWMVDGRRGEWSCCHAWSAHPLVQLSELVLGVKPLEPQWRTVRFAPLIEKGASASGIIPTPLGDISVSWDWLGEKPQQQITLPPGIRLEVAPSNRAF